MFSSIGLTISGLIFISLIAIFYFTKKRRRTLENDIFTVLLIFTIFMLLLELLWVCFMKVSHLYPIVTEILCRSYILSAIIWCLMIFTYLWTLNANYNYKSNLEIFNEKFIIILIAIGIISFSFSCFLPIEYISSNKEFFVINGPGVSVLYVCFVILCIYMCYFLFRNENKISFFKRIPLVLFLVFLLLISLYQFFNSDFNDLTFLFAFCIIGIYFTIENPDISLMEELEKANKDAEQADKEKTEFLSRMSHEIRTPINSIMGFSEAIMNEKDLTIDILKEDSKNINIAANNLLETIENILDISDIESGKELVRNENYSIKDIVYELNSYVQSKIGGDVEFVFNIDNEFPKILNGDKVKIYKILYGILSNSIKFTKSGQIKLEILSKIEKNDVRITFVISDSGIGIKEENLDKIFGKFSRLEQDNVNGTYNSTGLGLAIVKDLVELLDGDIKVESTYGVGTTFTVSLINKIVDKSNIGTVSLIKYDTTKYIDCSKYKVLLVDDNPLTLKATKDLLLNFKFDVSVCSNGIECINKIKAKEKYDMLIVDVKMEEMDGIKVINIIKNLDDYFVPNIIVATSDNNSSEEKTLHLKSGFTDYLIRPIEYKTLRKLILKYFNGKEGEK